MKKQDITVLLIEDNPGDARLIKEMIADSGDDSIDLIWADSLSAGLKRLQSKGIDLILLDLGLPDCQGRETYAKVHHGAPDVPIVLLTGNEDETLAMETAEDGAQDYLVKGQADNNVLVRSIRHALERHRQVMDLQTKSLVDELTGLHNRRGFINLASQQLPAARRTGASAYLFYADLDNMKHINDTLGHQVGDRALVEFAAALSKTFRRSDIVARIGGDEFVVMALWKDDVAVNAFKERLQQNLELHNDEEGHAFKLHASVGVARCAPEDDCSIDDLIKRADEMMYKMKKARKAA